LLEQGMAARRRHPERESRILDLHMHEIVGDPVGSVRRIYDHFDLELHRDVESRMHAFVAAHPKDEHGEHRYGPGAFGLDPESMAGAFKGYCEHFGVRPEPF
jgi:hypothetical protein